LFLQSPVLGQRIASFNMCATLNHLHCRCFLDCARDSLSTARSRHHPVAQRLGRHYRDTAGQ